MADLSQLQKLLQEMQNGKADLHVQLQRIDALKKIDDENGNTHELEKELSKFGIDTTTIVSLDKEKLQTIVNNLMGDAEVFKKDMLNPENRKAKGVENISNKIQRDFNSEKDGEKVVHLFNSFLTEEQTRQASGCFHYDQENCKGGIIGAHSLQCRGPLARISETESKQQIVVRFERDILTNKWQSGPISIKEASTFKGFCHHHDDIFSVIEKSDYIGSTSQNFLHSYRSFAYSYHKKLEHYAYYQNLIESTNRNASVLLGNLGDLLETIGVEGGIQSTQSTQELNITEEQKTSMDADKFEDHKVMLNEALRQEKYDVLEYFTLKLQHICPIACASLVKMHAEVGGHFLISDASKIYNGYPLMITIFHTSKDTSLILLARFKSDKATEIIFNQLRGLTQEQQEQRITNLIFEQVENFYLSPKFWSYLPQSEKDKISSDLNREKEQFPYRSTFAASMNIFDRMHALTP